MKNLTFRDNSANFHRMINPTQPQISFIIPVYNEAANITGVFQDLNAVICQHPEWQSEMIVIEDGSTDATRGIILKLVQRYPQTQVIFHDMNQGWVRSVQDGIAKSRGRYLMYIGADEEFDMSEVPAFITPLLAGDETHADVMLGVRWQRNAYKLHRFFMSVIYIFMLNAMFKLRINDYNWSQAWSRDLLESITIESKSLFMLPEIIIKAHDLGFKIKEIPSNHRGRKWGKSSLNLKIFGHALFESFAFMFKRNSKKYLPGISASQEAVKSKTAKEISA